MVVKNGHSVVSRWISTFFEYSWSHMSEPETSKFMPLHLHCKLGNAARAFIKYALVSHADLRGRRLTVQFGIGAGHHHPRVPGLSQTQSYASPAPGRTPLLLSAAWSHLIFFASLALCGVSSRLIFTQTSELSLGVDGATLDRPAQQSSKGSNP